MRLITLFAAMLMASGAHSAEIRVGTFNTESDSDTQPFRVAETIRAARTVHVWAFQEVESRNAAIEFTVAAAASAGRASYRYIISESGEITAPHRQNDFLVIVYNSSRLRHVETVELHGIRSTPGDGRLGKTGWGLRGALFARFHDWESGQEFYVGNVHLKCCGGDGPATRAHQTRILRQWVERADVPVILTGDFNIPIDVDAVDGNGDSVAFRTLREAMTWHRPSNPVKTQCHPRFNTMLDLFFTRASPGLTASSVEVQMPEPAYCELDKSGYSDHRPVTATFTMPE